MTPLSVALNFLRAGFMLLLAFTVSFKLFANPLKVLAPQNTTPTIADNSTTRTFTFKELGWDKSITINGYHPDYTFYIPLAKNIHPTKAVLHLIVAFSPQLTEATQLDIKFNQTFIHRMARPVDATQEVHLDLELPLVDLSSDWQALYFNAYLASGNQSLCSPDAWIYISPQSSLSITYTEPPFEGSLNHLNHSLFTPPIFGPLPIMLLLPTPPEPEEIYSLFRLVIQIGQSIGDQQINLITGFINEKPEQQKEYNVILIGTANRLIKNTSTFTEKLSSPQAEYALNNNAGLILLSQSPFNPLRGLLIFTGANDSALKKAISAFLAPEFSQMTSGNMAIIDSIQEHEIKKPVYDTYETSLSELGYPDQSVSGLGRHQLSYNIPLPNDRIPVNTNLKTYITSPGFTLKDNSQITLVMNGHKQAALKLVKEHSSWFAQVDASAMKPGVNRLDYLIDLHLEEEQCSRTNYDEIWATIHAETKFNTMFLNDVPTTTLNQLPVPFSTEVHVVVPDQLSKDDIANLSRLLFKMGQLIQPNPMPFHFVSSSETDEDFIRHHNIILYGTAANNPWITFAFGYMPIQLHGSSRVLTTPKTQIRFGETQSTGLLELMPSPWSEGNTVLLITGDDELALSQAVNQLIDDKARASFNGNVVLINADQSVEIINTEDTHYISLKNQIQRNLSNWGKNILYYLQNHPQALIYIIVFLVPFIVYLRRRKK